MDLGIPDTADATDTVDTVDTTATPDSAATPDTIETAGSGPRGPGTITPFPAAGEDSSAPAEEAAPKAGRSIDDIERLLGEVEDALARLDDGTYGHCASCGATLDDERLAESPTALRCGECDADGVAIG